jgi:hypothetical protein
VMALLRVKRHLVAISSLQARMAGRQGREPATTEGSYLAQSGGRWKCFAKSSSVLM